MYMYVYINAVIMKDQGDKKGKSLRSAVVPWWL